MSGIRSSGASAFHAEALLLRREGLEERRSDDDTDSNDTADALRRTT